MSLIIAAKGDLNSLKYFQPGEFFAFELYIRSIDLLLDDDIEPTLKSFPIVAIHTPSIVIVDNKPYPMNLCLNSKIGQKSVEVLEKLIAVCTKHSIPRIVVHAALYDTAMQTKEEAMQLLAKNVSPFLNLGVHLCFENDALWFTRFNVHRSLLSLPEDFHFLNKLLTGKMRITFDVEHLHFTYYMLEYLKKIGGESVFLNRYSEEDRQKFQVEMNQFITEHDLDLQKGFKEYTAFFIDCFKEKIEHFHLNGTDSHHYLFNSTTPTGLPLLGEHLPLGYNDGIIKDQLDYHFLLNQFLKVSTNKNICIVMEVSRSTVQEQIEWIHQSKVFLEKHLKISK